MLDSDRWVRRCIYGDLIHGLQLSLANVTRSDQISMDVLFLNIVRGRHLVSFSSHLFFHAFYFL